MGNGIFGQCKLEGVDSLVPGKHDKIEIHDKNASKPEFVPYLAQKQAAIKAVSRACLLARKVQESLVSKDTIQKKDRSPVTVADFAIQALIISELHKHFPDYPFIAEENSNQLRSPENAENLRTVLGHVQSFMPHMDEETLISNIDKGKTKSTNTDPAAKNYWWCLDPIDGTLGFLRNQQYAVCLALMENDQPVIGVLGCPSLPLIGGGDEHQLAQAGPHPGCLLVAVKGQGAFLRPLDIQEETKINFIEKVNPADSRFTESAERSHTSHDVAGTVAKILGIHTDPIRIDSQCKYAIVARGDANIYLRLPSSGYKEKIWDHTAGYLIVKEVGGEVTDVEGKPLNFGLGRTLSDNSGVVATTGGIHKTVLEAIAKAYAQEGKQGSASPASSPKKGGL